METNNNSAINGQPETIKADSVDQITKEFESLEKIITNPQPLDPKEQSKMQAMLGGGKNQAAKFIVGTKDQTEILGEESFKTNSTVLFKDCINCNYTVNQMCTKILIDGCHNTTITVNEKIVTSTLDVYKSNNFKLVLNTKIGTLQMDMCSNLKVEFHKKEDFHSLIWAGVHDLSLSFLDSPDTILTGYDQMKILHPELRETIDQFIIRFVHDKLTSTDNLLNEQIIRLINGYPTTEREKKIYDDRQEEALQILAKNAGIVIGKKSEKKTPPNAICPKCASGKKYKKCCGKNL